jgi:hypothetical protein
MADSKVFSRVDMSAYCSAANLALPLAETMDHWMVEVSVALRENSLAGKKAVSTADQMDALMVVVSASRTVGLKAEPMVATLAVTMESAMAEYLVGERERK